MGRKPIADERKYDELRIRLTDSERAELDKAAGKLPTSTGLETSCSMRQGPSKRKGGSHDNRTADRRDDQRDCEDAQSASGRPKRGRLLMWSKTTAAPSALWPSHPMAERWRAAMRAASSSSGIFETGKPLFDLPHAVEHVEHCEERLTADGTRLICRSDSHKLFEFTVAHKTPLDGAAGASLAEHP